MIQVNYSGEWVSAEELRAQLLEWDDQTCGPVLDLAGLEHIDAACLQVILSFQKNSRQPATGISCQNMSSAITDWINFAGAAGYLPNLASKTGVSA